MSDTSTHDPRRSDTPAATPAHEIALPLPTLLGLTGLVLALVLVIAAIERAQQLLGLVALAAIVAAVVAPVIERLGRGRRTAVAIVVVHLVLLVTTAALVGFAVDEIRTQSAALDGYVDDRLIDLEVEEGPNLLSRVGLSQRLGEATASWGIVAVVGEDAAPGIATRFSQLVIVIVLSAFLSRHGERLVDRTIRLVDCRDRRRRLREIWRDAVATAASFVRRSLALAACSGGAALVAAGAFGVPGLWLLGLWAAVASVVPLLGVLIGWAPIAIIAALQLPRVEATAAITTCVLVVVALLTTRTRLLSTGFGPTRFISAIGIAIGLSAAGLAGGVAGLFIAIAAARAATHDWSTLLPGATSSAADNIEEAATEIDERIVRTTTDNRLLMTVSWSSALRIAAVVVLAFMMQRWVTEVGPILVWAIVGVLIAVGLDRPIAALERATGARRWIVLTIAALLIGGIGAALAVTNAPGLSNIVTIEDDIPTVVESLESLPAIGDRLASAELDTKLTQLEARAPTWLSRSPLAGEAVDLIGGGLVGLFWTITIGLAALLDGPRLVAAASRRIPASVSRQMTRIARVTQTAIAGYAAGSAIVAALNAVVVATIALLFGLPLVVFLAAWAFGWNFIPQIGALIGWAPFLLLAFVTGPVTGVVCAAFFVVYQLVENNLIQPTIVGHAVDISALTALGAALFGAAIGGFLGAVLAVPTVGVVTAIVNEMRRDDFPAWRLARLRP